MEKIFFNVDIEIVESVENIIFSLYYKLLLVEKKVVFVWKFFFKENLFIFSIISCRIFFVNKSYGEMVE